MKHIAFLRAINVGGHTVKMDELRAYFEALKFKNVETFIASGNVIFDSPSSDAAAMEEKIEKQLKKVLGYDVVTCLRTADELVEIVEGVPGSKLKEVISTHVAFLRRPPEKAAWKALETLKNKVVEFHPRKREFYWHMAGPANEVLPIGPKLERALAVPFTMRNMNTVRKLAIKYSGEGK